MLPVLGPLWGQTVVTRPEKSDLPPTDEIWYGGVTQIDDNEWKYLKGGAKVRTSEMSITADEIDFNSDTSWTYARGHVRLEHYSSGDILNADHGEYNVKTEEGKFYAVSGTSPSKILTSPGMLTTTNPFFFESTWADRLKNRYILHHGYVTDCKMPKPWWKFVSPTFNVTPGEKASAHNAILFVHHIPVLYLPYFARPLGRNPRQSGFLTPNFGHSTIRGYMLGGGYYWAINRSYDVDYVLQDFSIRGPAHTLDFRGKPTEKSDFNFNYYAVQDKGLPQPSGTVIKEGGQEFELTAKTEIWGFTGKLDYNYLSSYLFRASFAGSYNTALSSEVPAIGYLQRHFNNGVYSLNFVFQRDQLFEAPTLENAPKNDVITEKLPAVEFYGRDNAITSSLPAWFSFSSSAGMMRREESDALVANPIGQAIYTLDSGLFSRVDVEPRVETAFHAEGFSLESNFGVGLTDYGSSYSSNSTDYYTPGSCGGYAQCTPLPSVYNVAISSASLLRKDYDFGMALYAPPIERVFTPPAWMHLGEKLKHVVELDAADEYVGGINEFQRIIHFDETDILSNTNQLTINLTNRIYKKDKKGIVSEFLTWRISQARYFDPTFGGAIVTGQHNVVLAALALSPYTFLDGPRIYSPIESSILFVPVSFLSIDYRSGYDPKRDRFIDQSIATTFRRTKYSFTVSDTAITSTPILVPTANQITFGGAYGMSTRKGWNLGGNVTYDLLLRKQLFNSSQLTYNTDCCGFSFELRRYNFGSGVTARDESQYLFSFTLANLGTFGSMQKQDRVF